MEDELLQLLWQVCPGAGRLSVLGYRAHARHSGRALSHGVDTARRMAIADPDPQHADWSVTSGMSSSPGGGGISGIATHHHAGALAPP